VFTDQAGKGTDLEIQLKCSGGLGAQLLAICYSNKIHEITKRKVVIRFTEMGNSYRTFMVGDFCTDIDFVISRNSRNLTPKENKSDFVLSEFKKSTNKVRNYLKTTIKRFGIFLFDFLRIRIYSPYLSLEKLKRIKWWSMSVDGYHADMRVIKDSWPYLRELVKDSKAKNFIEEAGTLNCLSVHWRLGDYLTTSANQTHGIVDALSLYRVIESVSTHHSVDEIKIFTDSPTVASQMISHFTFTVKAEVISSDIWSDLVAMSKSRFFIGSHSSISIFAALAILDKNPHNYVYFPEEWFKQLPEGFKMQGQNYHPNSVLLETLTYQTNFQ